MLDQFTIATKGGVVLWDKKYTEMAGTPANTLIQMELIPAGGGGEQQQTRARRYTTGPYAVQWTFANELNVIFVAVYQKILQLPYIDELLRAVKRHFVRRFEDEIRALGATTTEAGGGAAMLAAFPDFGAFDEEFENVWRAVEERDRRERAAGRVGGTPRRFEDTRKFQTTAKGAMAEMAELAEAKDVAFSDAAKDTASGRRQAPRMRAWSGRKGDGGDAAGKKAKAKKGAKENRVWGDRVTKEAMAALDYGRSSDAADSGPDERAAAAALVDERSKGTRTADGVYEVADVAERAGEGAAGFVLLDDEEGDGGGDRGSESSSGLLGMFRSLTRGRVLTAEVLAEPMARMREHLANKNVAAEIADQICQTVAKGMVGVRVGGLHSIRALVEQHMEVALTRILTPVS
ncbi:hypothetical protein GGI11_002998, partial [Coemansia sp. RSA 2049]